MNITRDMDSFDVFHLEEDATDEEIKSALKFHIEMYCGDDGNKKKQRRRILIKNIS